MYDPKLFKLSCLAPVLKPCGLPYETFNFWNKILGVRILWNRVIPQFTVRCCTPHNKIIAKRPLMCCTVWHPKRKYFTLLSERERENKTLRSTYTKKKCYNVIRRDNRNKDVKTFQCITKILLQNSCLFSTSGVEF